MDEETHVSEDGKQYLVVRIGNLEECKYAIGILDDAEIVCRMDVAESVRPELAKRGYYIVIVETAKAAEEAAPELEVIPSVEETEAADPSIPDLTDEVEVVEEQAPPPIPATAQPAPAVDDDVTRSADSD